MWDQLVAAINARNSAEAIRLIGQMSPQDFVKDYTKLNYSQSPIHNAAYQGLADVVEQLLNKKPDLIGMVDDLGYTALHRAARGGSEQVVNKLLQLKPDLIGMADNDGYTALHSAAGGGSEPIVNKLLQLKPDLIGMADNDGYTALHSAALGGSEQVVNKLLQLKPDLIGMVDNSGYTALHSAAGGGSEPIVNKLLQLKPDLIGMADNDGYTALHSAAEDGSEPIVNKLLQLKPDLIGMVDNDGYTALHSAARGGSEQVVNKLLQLRPDLAGMVDKNGYTALHSAAEGGSEQVVNKLLQLKPDLAGMVDNSGYTALHSAAENGSDQIAGAYSPEMLATVLRLKDKNNDDQQIRQFLDKAITTYDNDIEANADNASAYFKKANVLYALGRREEALKNYKKSLELNVTEINNSKAQVDAPVKEKQAVQNEAKASKTQFDKKTMSYSAEEITKLLDVQIGKQAMIKMVDLRQGKLEPAKVRDLVEPVMEENKIVTVIIQIHEESFANLLLRKNSDGDLQAIYNDPRGLAFIEEKNVKSLMSNVRDLESEANIVDLRQKQQVSDKDSVVFAVDNLVALAKNSTKDLKKPELQKLLSTSQQIESIKAAHSLIGDTNPWYSDDKLKKLLEIELKGKQVSIAPAVVFENKELLVEVTKTAAKEVMESGHLTVVPVHVHGNHWTGLVMRKQADCSLQVIYNDPKGDTLSNEKHSGALLKAISKASSKLTIIDLHKHQQNNDDDCGVFTVDNLVKLAICSPHSSVAAMQGLLATADSNGRADNLRINHANELCDAGIPVALPHNVDLTGGSTPTPMYDFNSI